MNGCAMEDRGEELEMRADVVGTAQASARKGPVQGFLMPKYREESPMYTNSSRC